MTKKRLDKARGQTRVNIGMDFSTLARRTEGVEGLKSDAVSTNNSHVGCLHCFGGSGFGGRPEERGSWIFSKSSLLLLVSPTLPALALNLSCVLVWKKDRLKMLLIVDEYTIAVTVWVLFFMIDFALPGSTCTCWCPSMWWGRWPVSSLNSLTWALNSSSTWDGKNTLGGYCNGEIWLPLLLLVAAYYQELLC